MLGLNETAGSGEIYRLQSLEQTMAVVEFDLDGWITGANEKFCSMTGYCGPELAGEHHSMFVEPAYRCAPEYDYFWTLLARGELTAREFRFTGKQGASLWLRAFYTPVKDADGAVTRIVSVVTDCTKDKLKIIDLESKVGALSRVQAIAEYSITGDILAANANFLHTFGYEFDEIRGKHHRILVDPRFAKSVEYERFWDALIEGNYVAASFKRLGKGGREVWIQASYNPVFESYNPVFESYKVVKIVQFASVILLKTAHGYQAWPITL